MTPRPLTLVYACSESGLYALDDRIPWDEPEDRQHFRRITMGHVMLMGRLTWASIGKPLPGRTTIVVSTQPREALDLPDGVLLAAHPVAALARAYEIDPSPCVVSPYVGMALLEHLTVLERTIVKMEPERRGGTFRVMRLHPEAPVHVDAGYRPGPPHTLFSAIDRPAWTLASLRETDTLRFERWERP